jgi:hypothetical protein
MRCEIALRRASELQPAGFHSLTVHIASDLLYAAAVDFLIACVSVHFGDLRPVLLRSWLAAARTQASRSNDYLAEAAFDELG